ncbi:unnamed protein product [Victoria cruziana]
MEAHSNGEHGGKENVYTYEAPWQIFSMNWSVREDKKFRLALGSFLEDYGNKVELIELEPTSGEFVFDPRLVFDHPYPPTKLMFIPDKDCLKPDLLSTSGDFLRIWEIFDDRIELKSLLSNAKQSDFASPLTSFDWDDSDHRRIITASIDTTCTVWDIETGLVDAQMIAHEKEVYDVAWGAPGIFSSVSADGSVRIFDLRDKDHSTILYENPQSSSPILRLAWNKLDLKFMAAVLMDSNKVVILDIRYPTYPVSELQKHHGSVNGVAWAPHSTTHLCTVGDDSRALIWELPFINQPVLDNDDLKPILYYNSQSEINQVQWSSLQSDWIAIAFSNKLQLLRL